MSASTAVAYMRLEARLLLREPVALFFTLAFPILLLTIFGSIWGNTPSPQYGSPGYVTLSLPGYIGMIIGTSGILTLSATAASYRELGFFRLLQTTPLTPVTILFGQVTTLLMVTTLGVALLILAGSVVWGATLAAHPVALVLAFCEGCVAFFSFGFLLAVLVPSVRSVQIVSMAVFFPMLFLSGAGLPSAILPPGIRAVAQYLPLTPLVSLLNWSWFGGRPEAFFQGALALAVFTVLNLVLISRLGRRDDRDEGGRVGRVAGMLLGLGAWLLAVFFVYWE